MLLSKKPNTEHIQHHIVDVKNKKQKHKCMSVWVYHHLEALMGRQSLKRVLGWGEIFSFSFFNNENTLMNYLHN